MSLPIIDVEKYFNDPSIPDGINVGFVNPQGVVHDRFGKAIGIDSKHESAKLQESLNELHALVERGGRAGQSQPARQERKIHSQWTTESVTVAIDNFGHVWVYDGLAWQKAKLSAVLPPLPQGA